MTSLAKTPWDEKPVFIPSPRPWVTSQEGAAMMALREAAETAYQAALDVYEAVSNAYESRPELAGTGMLGAAGEAVAKAHAVREMVR